jgi:hypothetical protein
MSRCMLSKKHCITLSLHSYSDWISVISQRTISLIISDKLGNVATLHAFSKERLWPRLFTTATCYWNAEFYISFCENMLNLGGYVPLQSGCQIYLTGSKTNLNGFGGTVFINARSYRRSSGDRIWWPCTPLCGAKPYRPHLSAAIQTSPTLSTFSPRFNAK